MFLRKRSLSTGLVVSSIVRAFVFCSVLFLSVFAISQPSGNYKGTSWSVSPNRTLIWGGSPFLPTGWRIAANPASINRFPEGFSSALLEADNVSEIKPAVQAAEAKGLTYLLAPRKSAPESPAFLVQPGSFRIEGAQPKGQYKIPIKNGRSAYYLLVSSEGYGIDAKGWADVVDGFATIKLNLNVASEKYVLLVFPRVVISSLPDYWEGFDQARDEVLTALKNAGFGNGLRGIVNPFGTPEMWTSPQGGFVPDSEMFRLEFQAFLESKYHKDIDALARGWKLKAFEIETFKQASRMVAMFSKTRGVDRLLDPQSEALVPVDMRESNYWTDVQTVINNAAVRRTSRFAEAIRRTVDVPVIYDWLGWSPIYDGNKPSGDGLGMRSIGSGTDATQSLAVTTSTALAWQNRGWLLMTSATNYGDKQSLQNVISDSIALGAKGWFLPLGDANDFLGFKEISDQIHQDASISSISPRPLFYPENARFPANTMRLPAGYWWLPTPAAGNRIEYGSGYEAYRHEAPYGTFFAIWRTNQPAKIRLLCREPSKLIFRTHDGLPIETKVLKDSVELTLGTIPIVMTGNNEIPVPADAMEQLVQDYKLLSDYARKRGINIDDPRFFFEDAYRKAKENPGLAFADMMENYRKMQIGTGAFWWKEAELPEKSNFGDLLLSPALSEEKALLLSTSIAPPTNTGYFAEYQFRTDNAQECDLWIAGNFPAQIVPFVEIQAGSQRFTLPERAFAGYGDSFNWYKVGRFLPNKGTTTITIRVAPNAPIYRLSLDVILLTPFAFRPSGISMPIGY